MYRVESTRGFERQCKRLHFDRDEKAAQRLQDAIDKIAENPFVGKMKEKKFKGCYKRRIGDYRLVYYLDTKKRTCYLIDIDRRKDVYK